MQMTKWQLQIFLEIGLKYGRTRAHETFRLAVDPCGRLYGADSEYRSDCEDITLGWIVGGRGMFGLLEISKLLEGYYAKKSE